jgi:hypothetical protein
MDKATLRALQEILSFARYATTPTDHADAHYKAFKVVEEWIDQRHSTKPVSPTQEVALFNGFENKLLDIIDHVDDFTRGDLQGVIEALVRRIYKAGADTQTL